MARDWSRVDGGRATGSIGPSLAAAVQSQTSVSRRCQGDSGIDCCQLAKYFVVTAPGISPDIPR